MSESFPAAGHSYEARFGDLAFRLDFDDDGQHLTFRGIGSASAEPDQRVACTAIALREGLYLVHWQEAGGSTVTHVEDFARETVHTRITSPDGKFLALTGTLKRIP